jgi:mannonate dehydratase
MPSQHIHRRSFIKSGCVAAGGLGLLPAAAGMPLANKANIPASSMKLGLDVGVANSTMLKFMKQLGAEWVSTTLLPTQGEAVDATLTKDVVIAGFDKARGGIGGPPAGLSGPWKEEELQQLKTQVEAAGLKLGSLYLHSFPNVILGNRNRDKDIESVCESVRLAGRFGVPVLLYNFYGLRNVEGLYARPGRGGAGYRAFNNDRVATQKAVAELGNVSEETMWKRLHYFLEAVVPVAEKAGVRLAQHPNDPPVLSYRGIAQPFATIEQWKRLVNAVRSPYNGIVLDTGVIAQLNGNAAELVRYFGRRDCINHVHFRNARCEDPHNAYYETFIDEGAANLPAAMKALYEIGYSRGIVPDHSPSIMNDANQFGAWGYALGYIRALMQATQA